ncbi:tyrosine-protein kinase domain-containing protein [Myxosarcina sp. GI1]|uniref:GumC family protein n=1 Tax=Myxosarcina sp. GI1 TaxID=1541065 RepID=UPI0005667844|nr:tyrosine-protein kinase domain-containing protein [Myxosarcina sp. GI1]
MNHTVAVMRKHWLPLLGLNAALVGATVFAATVLVGRTFTPTWTAEAKLNIPSSGGNLSADLGPLGNLNDSGLSFSKEVNPLQIQAAIIGSDKVIERVLEEDSERYLYPKERLNAYKNLFEVEPQPQSTTLTVTAQGSQPELALERANNIIDSYQQRLQELRQQDASTRENTKELETARQDLIEAQTQLAQFRQSTGIVDSDVQAQELINSLSELKTRRSLVKAQADASQTKARVTSSNLGISSQTAVDSLRLAGNTEYQQVRESLSQLEVELSNARGQFKEGSPQIKALLQRRAELRQQLQQTINTAVPNAGRGNIDYTLGTNGSDNRLNMIAELLAAETAAKQLQQESTEINSQIANRTQELNNISQNKARLAELQRKYEIAEGVYKGIIAQTNRAKIDNFNSYPNVQLIDGPALDPEPTDPNYKLIALGGLLASAFGSLGLLMFLESRDPLLSLKDLQLVKYPVLVSISQHQTNLLENIEYSWTLDSVAELEFQKLASAFSFLNLENRRVAISSAAPGEGKTTVTIGLALALVKLGFKVLVVDGDIHRATLSERLQISQQKAIESEDGQSNLATSSLATIVPGLDALAAPAIARDSICKYFVQGDFERQVDALQKTGNYDYVLVDSAPVNAASEMATISSVIRNFLFVVQPGRSGRYSVMSSLEQLRQYNAQIAGLVVNGIESRPTNYYYYGIKQPLLEAQT